MDANPYPPPYPQYEADPVIAEARERLEIAKHNQQWDWLYTNARDLHAAGKMAAAREALETLWKQAPYFGDPGGVARAIGLPLLPTYEQVKAKEQAQRDEQERLEAIRAKKEEKASLASRKLDTSRVVLWLWALAMVAGVGSLCAMLLPAWPYALAVTIALAVGAYVLAFRRIFSPLIFIPLLAIAVPVVLIVSFLFAGVDFNQQIQLHMDSSRNGHDQFVPAGSVSLGTQLLFGAAYSGTLVFLSPVLGYAATFLSKKEDNRSRWFGAGASIPFVGFGVLLGLPSNDLTLIVGGGFYGIVWSFLCGCILALAYEIFQEISDIFRGFLVFAILFSLVHLFGLWFLGPLWFGLSPLVSIPVAAGLAGVPALIAVAWAAIHLW